MFGYRPKNKRKKVQNAQNVQEMLNTGLENEVITDSLDKNTEIMKKLFLDDDTMIYRTIQNNNSKQRYSIMYTDGLVNSIIINDYIIKPLMLSDVIEAGKNQIDTLLTNVITIDDIKKTNKISEIVKAVTYGDSILFSEGSREALILNTKGFKVRSIDEPDSEKNLSGPKEGFSESILMNLSMIHRKVRSNQLKMKYYTFGTRTNTQACICYIDSIVNKDILKELYKRLDKINIDGVLDTNYLTELIKDAPYSPFRTIGYTERPDVVVGRILEGRIAIFLDGTPVVLTVPYLFVENFQSGEDYYLNFYYTSFSRMLRMVAFVLTIIIPGFYISIVAFHQEMLPTPLLINISIERKSVPLPAAVEALLLLLVFDILRETGVRMPSSIGQAMSIVGALVLGQAAVDAKLVAAPMIIVVALTAITSLVIPKLNAPIIYCRYFLLLLSSMFGLLGLTMGLSLITIHVLSLRSFGVSQVIFIKSLNYQQLKDIFIRGPWTKMITRPSTISKDNVRMKVGDGNQNG